MRAEDLDVAENSGVSTAQGYIPVPTMAVSDESLEVYHSTWAKKWEDLGKKFGRDTKNEQQENKDTENETRV
jgi:hypothetical protein